MSNPEIMLLLPEFKTLLLPIMELLALLVTALLKPLTLIKVEPATLLLIPEMLELEEADSELLIPMMLEAKLPVLRFRPPIEATEREVSEVLPEPIWIVSVLLLELFPLPNTNEPLFVLVKPRRTLLSENFHTPMDSFHCWLYEAV